jgi:two-component system sensor histidine kinase KdpD
MRVQILVMRAALGIAAIAVLTTAYVRFLIVNPTTVALSYLVVILLVAGSWGIVEATAAAVVAVFCFNFFFLPPVGTLTIADPQNWVALIVFLVTAVVVSQLSGRARQRNVEALSRQRDLERLYALSRSLLLSQSDAAAPSEIARFIADAFELPGLALYEHQASAIFWAGSLERPELEDRLRDVARQAVTYQAGDVLITAIRLGGAPIGSLAIIGPPPGDTVLQSITNLAAIGLERARGQAATTRAEAARQSSELRAAVLDAAAHEFKTPLTSMKAAASALRTGIPESDPNRELVEIVNEDLERLQALVTDAIQMLRIDSGDFVVQRARYRVGDLVQMALKEFEARLQGHTVNTAIPGDLAIDADRNLVRLALRQLLDNALKYSPSNSTIDVRAAGNGSVEIAVRNSGSSIPEREQRHIFDRYYRGDQSRHLPGTGMGLAIVQQIARAHNGSLSVSSRPDSGTEFTLSLPREEQAG